MSNDHFQFVRPETQLPPYFKACCRDLRVHKKCIVHDEKIREMARPDVDTAAVLQIFMEACRWISVEMDQNLLIDDMAKPPHLIIALAPQNHEGTLPEAYKEDDDGKGLLDKEPVALPDPEGPQLDLDAKFDT